MKMKYVLIPFLLWCGHAANAQYAPQLDSLRAEAETAGPALLDYEPDMTDRISQRREQLRELRARLDTLEIPETRRYRMMRDLYRGKDSRLLQKYLYAGLQDEDSDPDR